MTADPPGNLRIRAGKVVTPGGALTSGTVTVSNGAIAEVSTADSPTAAQALDFPDGTLLPGFVDLHVHGGGGWRIGIGRDGETNPVSEVSRFLASTGVTSFLPTIGTTTDDRLLAALRDTAELVGKALPGAEVLGAHVEGPYLNSARKGAMRAELFRPPDAAHFERCWEASSGSIRYMTLAPELEGALKFVERLVAMGVVASAGHTDAVASDLRSAFAAGVGSVTHLFNAMRGIHHREPGVAGAALAHDGSFAELIGDGIHVHPEVMRTAIRAKGVEQIAVITDGGSFTGRPDGTYREGERVVTVREGKCTLPNGTLAGSASPMNRNCLVLRNEVGLDWIDIARMTSLNPAIVLGEQSRKGSVEVGKDADLTVLGTSGEVLLTTVKGRIVYQKEESGATQRRANV